MENQFLRQVASYFKDNSVVSSYTFVFPNRRASLFFKKYIGELSDKPLFAPRIVTISELFGSLTELQSLDELSLLFRLWKEYTALQRSRQIAAGVAAENVEIEPIDDFFYWGKILLSDFNDIDQYLIDASSLFTNINDISNIKQDYSYLTDNQIEALKKLVGLREGFEKREVKRRYFDIWDMLLQLYTNFRTELVSSGKCYPALQYRIVAEAVMERKTTEPATLFESHYATVAENLDKIERIVFIGFSAPTECEKQLMRFFKRKNQAADGECTLFFWDYYSKWVKAPQNKSSMLISSCVDEFPAVELPLPNGGVTEGECLFEAISVTGPTEQAMVTGRLLNRLEQLSEPINTAVVVSDENLLLPLLGAIPKGAEVNITMGFPLKSTSLYSLYAALAELHIKASDRAGQKIIAGQSLIKILQHPYIKAIGKAAADKLSKQILDTNMLYIKASALQDETFAPSVAEAPAAFKEFLTLMLFPNEESLKAISLYHRRLFTLIMPFVESQDRGFINCYLDILDRIELSEIELQKIKVIYGVIGAAVKSATVAFRGEPLKGLQIMGPLETRALDFENIIFLSFNEGVYPANGEQSSSIPYFLRRAFGMPTYENNDSISSYNFYRLLQRAKRVFMIYDTNSEDIKTKEESRFIKQLKYDFGAKVKAKEYLYALPTPAGPLMDSLYISNREQLANLQRFFDSSNGNELSASSLNNYIDCERRFYFDKILKIKEQDELSDSVDASNYGTIFHYAMKSLYDQAALPKGDNLFELTKSGLEALYEKICKKDSDYLDNIIAQAFRQELKINTVEGENLLIRESVKQYIKNTLKADIKLIQKRGEGINLVGNEYQIFYRLAGAKLKAVLDRVEQYKSRLCVCDYKSGTFLDKVEQSAYDKTVESLSDANFSATLDKMFEKEGKRDKLHTILFQMMLYALLLTKHLKWNGSVELAVYQLKVVDKFGPVNMMVNEEKIAEFEKRLSKLIKEIEDKCVILERSAFAAAQNEKACAYCNYAGLCKRKTAKRE